MTITLTQNIRNAGSVVTAGTTVTYDPALEADLVRRGCATYTVPPMTGGTQPVFYGQSGEFLGVDGTAAGGRTAVADAAIASGRVADATAFAATVAATYATIANTQMRGVAEVKNGATAQELRVFNATDGINAEYASISWLSNEALLSTTLTGTGASRALRIRAHQNLYLSSQNGTYAITFGNNFLYGGGVRLGLGANGWGGFYLDYTNTGTVGAVTINKPSGRVNAASGATSLVVTNNLVTAASRVLALPASNDSTGRVTAVVPAVGSFTIYMTAPAAQMAIDFVVIGAD